MKLPSLMKLFNEIAMFWTARTTTQQLLRKRTQNSKNQVLLLHFLILCSFWICESIFLLFFFSPTQGVIIWIFSLYEFSQIFIIFLFCSDVTNLIFSDWCTFNSIVFDSKKHMNSSNESHQRLSCLYEL